MMIKRLVKIKEFEGYSTGVREDGTCDIKFVKPYSEMCKTFKEHGITFKECRPRRNFFHVKFIIPVSNAIDGLRHIGNFMSLNHNRDSQLIVTVSTNDSENTYTVDDFKLPEDATGKYSLIFGMRLNGKLVQPL